MNVRNLVCTIAAVALAYSALKSVQAQEYPTKSVRLLVSLAPGGGNDTLARIFGQKLAEARSQQVIVDNRPGAATTIATAMAARAAPRRLYAAAVVDRELPCIGEDAAVCQIESSSCLGVPK
ncbi:MAG TPA: hypothetical protein VGO08_13135 [Burkholderiales bacterium]|nr:hypothetical protein [Burkholderiales bacterium]